MIFFLMFNLLIFLPIILSVSFCLFNFNILEHIYSNTITNWFFFKIVWLYQNNVMLDSMSAALFLTTIFTLFLCIIISDNKYLFNKKLHLFILLFFSFFLFFYFFSTNIFSFFLWYEFLLIPSYLIVINTSPNRRSSLIGNYFILWTQIGSFLVLLGLINLYKNTNNLNFFDKIHNLFLVQIFIFFGFGIKIPLWPFHFWLSKTHVEANTGFSIFLSGVLVKTAVYGLYKFFYIFISSHIWFFLSICFISIVDASFKMCIQNDLKKLVAYSTIQEMGLITSLLLLHSLKNNQLLIIFAIFHTFISGLFFWIVECVYKRYKTRVVYNISGIVNFNPSLSMFIILSTYLFLGVPFTTKFSIEVYVLKNIYNFNIILTIFVGFLLNYISMIFFFKTFIFINFGNNLHICVSDINKKETAVFAYFIFGIIFLNFI